jgi:protein-tyrosine phosphatase
MSWWFAEYGWGEVAPGLCTGAQPQDAADVGELVAGGITTVVNLCADGEYPHGARERVAAAYAAAGVVEHRLASVDYGNLAPALLDAGARVVGGALDAGERVYLHCRAGWQRSATVAAAALVVRDGVAPRAALVAIRARRPEARPLPHQVADLRRWHRNR